MIRKAIIVTLTLAAVGECALALFVRHYTPKFQGNSEFVCAGPSGISWIHEPGVYEMEWEVSVERSERARKFRLPRFIAYPDLYASYMHGAWVVDVPHWLILLLFGTYPAIAFIRGPLRCYRRRKRGLCLTCGYDLTGTPERCPECGAKIETK